MCIGSGIMIPGVPFAGIDEVLALDSILQEWVCSLEALN